MPQRVEVGAAARSNRYRRHRHNRGNNPVAPRGVRLRMLCDEKQKYPPDVITRRTS